MRGGRQLRGMVPHHTTAYMPMYTHTTHSHTTHSHTWRYTPPPQTSKFLLFYMTGKEMTKISAPN